MSCRSLKKPKLADIGSEMVSLNVGEGMKRQTFSIHKILLQKTTKFFDKLLESESGKKGLIFLNSEDLEIFRLFNDWLYTGNVSRAPVCVLGVKNSASEIERQKLEEDFRKRFDKHTVKLVDLYVLAERLNNESLQNKTIDTIQDAFNEYGAVFGPGLLDKIFLQTKPNSQLRDLAVAANVMHMDRGCLQLRQELMRVCIMCPDFLPHMLRWISRNFAMLVRRATEGFSMIDRAKLCSCHFHKHAKAGAHEDHAKCAVPFNKCGHADGEEADSLGGLSIADMLGFSLFDGPLGSATH